MIYAIDRFPPVIKIGVQGENEVATLRINAEPWLNRWPGMELSVWATLPGSTAAYQAQSHMEGSILVWDVTSADTSVQGAGTVEIIGRLGEHIKKTGPVRTSISKTSTDSTADPPESQQPWYVGAMDAADRAEAAADRAEEIAGIVGPGGGGSSVIIDDTLTKAGAAADAKATGEKIGELSEDKADKAYMIELFNELKALILSGDTDTAVALLDQAILDNTILA